MVCLKAACLAVALLGAQAQVQPDPILKRFQEFVEKFEKKYEDDAEFHARFQAFSDNLAYIESENLKGNNPYQLGLTEMADMTIDEFRMQKLGYNGADKVWEGVPYLGRHEYDAETSLPSAVDWVAKGAVTPVKNQGQCGSCWSFSTTGSLEGAWQIATGKLVSLSEQQLVDCAKSFGEMGCGGGEMDSAFQYVQKNGLDTEASYPYKAKNGICKASSGTVAIPKGSVTGFKDVHPNDMKALMDAVSKGPVSIAIEADQMAFQLYKGGVLTGACGTKLDHGVLLVGYGTEDGKDYWLVKNSWGNSWGEKGYGKLLRGKPGAGECGIKMQPSYPVVSASPSPGPSPSPPSPPSPPAPSSSHYEKPPCQSDEQSVQVQGIEGVTCVPKCDGMSCPTDVPPGTTAKPQCVLQDPSGDKYCALTCFLGGCPTGATCKHAGLIGLCMYDKDENSEKLLTLTTKRFELAQPAITV